MVRFIAGNGSSFVCLVDLRAGERVTVALQDLGSDFYFAVDSDLESVCLQKGIYWWVVEGNISILLHHIKGQSRIFLKSIEAEGYLGLASSGTLRIVPSKSNLAIIALEATENATGTRSIIQTRQIQTNAKLSHFKDQKGKLCLSNDVPELSSSFSCPSMTQKLSHRMQSYELPSSPSISQKMHPKVPQSNIVIFHQDISSTSASSEDYEIPCYPPPQFNRVISPQFTASDVEAIEKASTRIEIPTLHPNVLKLFRY